MNKIFGLFSTILIAVGLLFLFVYFSNPIIKATEFFERPSYYVQQNFYFIFLAGAAVLLFSVAASFFSWLKILQREESLPNAVYAKKEDIHEWMKGTSLETERISMPTDDDKTDLITISEEEKTYE